ncbi:hypothetical protein S40285_04614 [Stachybotrys chlorohalonatus IBT 40285]|jgi:HSP20 family molecular chaperone IbpA|uniref:SHSP domain-containing protein n=1 Tax=Stachybotrys chlorohalonatus (strain IBT 40285) TaxID=1283841 RepID=A0A084QZT5_STAC4|nr:hypothetical protein S40285_04614 [Stachybotrys chlorohalonata IBT 40285]
MAFFPRTIYNTDTSFTPLFRLLDEFDKYSRNGNGNGSSSSPERRSAMSHWQPRFDVRETDAAYELHGELPGMAKDNLTIEFPEPQTLVVRGRTERTYTAGTPPAGLLEENQQQQKSIEERRNSHQATVEDDREEAGGKTSTSDWEAVEKHDAAAQNKQQQQQQPVDKARYWLSERSIGEFSRTFNFPTRIEQDGVSANLKDGILSVIVPKAKKHEPRRIAIN